MVVYVWNKVLIILLRCAGLIFTEYFPSSDRVHCGRGSYNSRSSARGTAAISHKVTFTNDIRNYVTCLYIRYMRDNNNYCKSAADDWPRARNI